MQAALADFFMFKLLTGRPDTGYMTTPTHHPHPNEHRNVLTSLTGCYSTGWKIAHVIVEAAWTVELVTNEKWAGMADLLRFKLLTGWPDTGYKTPPPPPPWTSQCSSKPGQLLQHWLKGCTCRCRGCTHSGVYDVWWLRCTDRLLNIQAFDWLSWH